MEFSQYHIELKTSTDMEDGDSCGIVSLTLFYLQNHVSLKKGKGSLINWCSIVLSTERDRKEKEKMNTARDFKRAKISNRTQKNSLTCALPRKKKNDKILEFIWHGEVILKVLFLSRHLFTIHFRLWYRRYEQESWLFIWSITLVRGLLIFQAAPEGQGFLSNDY